MIRRQQTDTLEYYIGEHLRMSGVYWGMMAFELMRRRQNSAAQQTIVEWVMQCYNNDRDPKRGGGGFAGNVGHDSHLLYTLSAIQVLALCDQLQRIDVEHVADCMYCIVCDSRECICIYHALYTYTDVIVCVCDVVVCHCDTIICVRVTVTL